MCGGMKSFSREIPTKNLQIDRIRPIFIHSDIVFLGVLRADHKRSKD